MTRPLGEVYDLGYRHYEGPREGRMRARKALWVNGLRTSLGLGRGARAKILPVLLFVAVMTPAVVIVMIASTIGVADDLPGHSGYYFIVSLVVLLFSAIIAPELLCTDRRNRVLHLYLVRPLTPDDYVVGRWLAFFTITLALVYSGQIVLFAGFTLAADEPFQYLRDNWLDVPRFLAAGAVIAVFTTTIPLMVASFTVRRTYATGFVIGLFMISAAAAGILTDCDEENVQVECEPLTGDRAKWFEMINLGAMPIAISDMIFGEDGRSELSLDMTTVAELPTAAPIAWYLFLSVGPALVLLWRYRRVDV